MITKLNLNSKRISSIIAGLMVFIVSFNLLHSVIIIKDERDLVAVSDLAEQLAAKEREILIMREQKTNLQNLLNLRIAQMVKCVKAQWKEKGDLPAEVDLTQDGLSVDFAQAALSAKSKAERQEQLMLSLEHKKPINVERLVQNKIIEAVLKAHLCKMGQIIDGLKTLKRRAKGLSTYKPGSTEAEDSAIDGNFIKSSLESSFMLGVDNLRKEQKEILCELDKCFYELDKCLERITCGTDRDDRAQISIIRSAREELVPKFEEVLQIIVDLDESKINQIKPNVIRQTYTAHFTRLVYPSTITFNNK